MGELAQQHEGLDQILPAIAKAIGRVKIIAKSEKYEGKGGGYEFASIDDFLSLVNPICSEEGIILNMDEDEIEDFTKKGQYGDSSWMRITFSIRAYHVSGQSLPPVKRTVEVLRNGAQAYGSAQSYALKQYLRALLLIPTGDKDDADHRSTDDGQVAASAPPPKQQQKQAPQKTPQQIRAKSLSDEISAITTEAGIKSFWDEYANEIGTFPQKTQDYFTNLSNEKEAKLVQDDPFMEAAE
jgi:hypothetical protein